MKWEYYNLMTDKDKEEYNYKFDEDDLPSFLPMLSIYMLQALATIVAFAFLAYVSAVGNATLPVSISTSMFNILERAFQLSFYVVILLMAEVTFRLVHNIVWFDRRTKWLKQKGYHKKIKALKARGI